MENTSLENAIKISFSRLYSKVWGKLEKENVSLKMKKMVLQYLAFLGRHRTRRAHTIKATWTAALISDTIFQNKHLKIVGKILQGRKKSASIKKRCELENTNDWVLRKKIKRNDYITRMTEGEIMKLARDKSPSGRQSTERPENFRVIIFLHTASYNAAQTLKRKTKKSPINRNIPLIK